MQKLQITGQIHFTHQIQKRDFRFQLSLFFRYRDLCLIQKERKKGKKRLGHWLPDPPTHASFHNGKTVRGCQEKMGFRRKGQRDLSFCWPLASKYFRNTFERMIVVRIPNLIDGVSSKQRFKTWFFYLNRVIHWQDLPGGKKSILHKESFWKTHKKTLTRTG